VASKTFDRCIFTTTYDGLSIGADLGNQVSKAYRGPNPFQGTIERMQINIDSRPTTILETARFIKELAFRQ